MQNLLGYNLIQLYAIVLMGTGLFAYYVIGKSLSGFSSRLFKVFGTGLTWWGLLLYLMDHINNVGY